MSLLLTDIIFPAPSDLITSLRPPDAVDILVLAALLFALISWIRRSKSGSASRRVWALAVVFGILYLLADQSGLYLITRLLRGVLILLVITVVIVLQPDIRRFMDRVLTWKFSRLQTGPLVHSPVEVLVSSVEGLAESRTGALIAIRGNDPWGSYINGGVALEGRISRPLLESIFDTSSDGHDGAVLVEGDRITRFAVHLPLTTALPEASRFGGTRHAAAVGLAEVRDAFVIVVSEERGTVGVAQDGSLTELERPAALAPLLQKFWMAHYGKAAEQTSGRARRRLESGAAALAIACLAWVIFGYGGTPAARSFKVPVEIRNFPADWALDADTVPFAVLTVAGSQRAMNQLNPATLTLGVGLARPQPGLNRVPITNAGVYLPPGVRLVAADPRYLSVIAHRLVRSTLPIYVRTTTPLPDSIQLQANPASLTVLFPPGESSPSELYTRRVDLTAVRQNPDLRAEVVLPAGTRLLPDQSAEVSVRMARSGGTPKKPAPMP